MIRFLLLAALALVISGTANAQTDTSYFVGAVKKTDVAALAGGNTVAVAVSGATQVLTYPAAGDITYDVTLSANCTFSVVSTNTVSGRAQIIHLIVRNPAGTFTTTLPTVKWHNAAAPTIVTTAGTVLEIDLTTSDGGTTLVAK